MKRTLSILWGILPLCLFIMLITAARANAPTASELSSKSFIINDNVSITRMGRNNESGSSFVSHPTVKLSSKAASQWPHLAKALENINARALAKSQEMEAKLVEIISDVPVRGRYISRLRVVRADPKIVSLQLIGSWNAGGSSSQDVTTFVLTPGNGELCQLDKFIPTQNYLSPASSDPITSSPLQRLILAQLFQRDEDSYLLSKAELTQYVECKLNGRKYADHEISPFSFTATSSGLRFFFDQYEIAPGASGCIYVDVNYQNASVLFTDWSRQLFEGQPLADYDDPFDYTKSYDNSTHYRQLAGQWKLVSATVNGKSCSARELGMQASITFTQDGSAHYLSVKGNQKIDDYLEFVSLCNEPISKRLGAGRGNSEPGDASGWTALMFGDYNTDYRATILPDGNLALYRLDYTGYYKTKGYTLFRGVFKRQ